jgi:Na+-translocating ferredoxin:NAD+ oxidoreductase RnfC subunit
MSEQETIMRVSATGGLNVRVGDRVGRGQKLSAGPSTDSASTAPVSGIVESIHFDPGQHEFVIVITTTSAP